MRDIIIIGSGPAGFTAAIYAARAELEPLLIASSVEIGGELMNTTEVENFPGFPEGIQGPELMTKLQEQAERFGTEVVYDDVVEPRPRRRRQEGDARQRRDPRGRRADLSRPAPPTASSASPTRRCLSGHGVSWCATCDGFFFRQKTIAVVGGGDSAMEEATFLTRFADKVYVIHRRDSLARLEDHAAARVRQREDRVRLEHRGHRRSTARTAVTGVTLRDTVTGEERALDLDGLFVAIGNDPRTHLVHGKLDLTPEGTIARRRSHRRRPRCRRLRRRRRDRPDLPTGRHGRRFGHRGRPRRRALPRRPRGHASPRPLRSRPRRSMIVAIESRRGALTSGSPDAASASP